MVHGIQTCHSLYPVTVRHNLRKKFLKGETETKTLKGKARSQTCQVPLSAVIDENPVLVEEVHDFVDRLSLVLDGLRADVSPERDCRSKISIQLIYYGCKLLPIDWCHY